MGMTAFYGDFDRDEQEAESLKTIGRALELGINFLDTAWIYQVYCTSSQSSKVIASVLKCCVNFM